MKISSTLQGLALGMMMFQSCSFEQDLIPVNKELGELLAADIYKKDPDGSDTGLSSIVTFGDSEGEEITIEYQYNYKILKDGTSYEMVVDGGNNNHDHLILVRDLSGNYFGIAEHNNEFMSIEDRLKEIINENGENNGEEEIISGKPIYSM